MQLFSKYTINNQQPDAIVFDTVMQKHKAVRYEPIKNIDADAYFLKTMQGIKIYNHGSLKDGNNDPLMILIGSKSMIKKQIETSKTLKFVPNIELLEKNNTQATTEVTNKTEDKKNDTPPKKANNKKDTNKKAKTTLPFVGKFSINDIKLGEEYTGYVKLLYNYGIFVTVK